MFTSKLIIAVSCLLFVKITALPSRSKSEAHDFNYWDSLNKTCLSYDCDEQVNVKHIEHITTHMNHNINPCVDFHAYACGHWQQQHPQQVSVMTMGEQQLNDKYVELFKKSSHSLRQNLKGNLIMHKMQQYLDVCVQSESITKASWSEYIHTLREMGYLQLTKDTNWLNTLREVNRFSNSRHFISLQITRENVTRYMLSIYPHTLSERVKFTSDIYDILKVYTNDSFEKLEEDFKNLELDLENILNTSCQNAIVDENNECDHTEWRSYDQLINSNTTINWEFLLADFPLELKDQLFINDLQNIEKIKAYLDHSSQKTLFLYTVSRFVNYLQSLPYNIIDKGTDLQNCLRHTRKHFPLAFNYLYEKAYYQHLRPESDRVIRQIFYQLKKQFSLILNTNEMQLSPESVQYLKNKLSHVTLNIGNLPLNASQEFYEEFLSDLNVTQNFYVNHLLALKHFFQRQRLLASSSKFEDLWFTFNLHMPSVKDDIDSTPYYFTLANVIILPFAYLQLPLYDHRFWHSLLYGDLANTLGHELIHAFDPQFLEYDFSGNYNKAEALAITSNKNFQQHIACLSKEPTKFLTERVADISGTHLSLKTFAKDPLFLKHNGKLFFLQFAQFFCGSSPLETFSLHDNTHDLDSLRLNYTLSHMPEFAEVFQCPLGSPMNPFEKCKLW